MNTTESPTPKAADADLLGEATNLELPEATDVSSADMEPTPAESDNFQQPRPAEDENQPGFIGERNVPHP